jgi:AraC-like DNA-binding protein
MAALQRFSTSGLPPRQRLEFWDELCSARTPVTTQALDLGAFQPSCARICVGDLPVAEICSSASTVDHSNGQVAQTRESVYFLHVQVAGSSLYRQGGREAHLRQGDFTLLSSSRPFQMVFAEPNRTLSFQLPERLVQRQLPCAQSLVALRMPYQDNLVCMVSQFAAGLWRECAGPGVEEVGPALVSAFLHMLGSAYARRPEAQLRDSISLENRRFQILRYIEGRLQDRDLSPVTIGARFKQSPRSLHMLFAKGPETVSRYILRRRLEESARVLANPLQRARTISEVAFDNGFCSSAHFCKVFREHFHVTPTQYRARVGVERCADDERVLLSR